jgi:hypothetical protein
MVANLTCSIQFQSENPNGPNRFHSVHLRSARGVMAGVRYTDGGRSDFTQDREHRQSGHSGTIGIYAEHNHGDDDDGSYTFRNCVIERARKWGLALHSGHGNIHDNVIVNCGGAGIVCEAGDERGVIARNFIAGIVGLGLSSDGKDTFGDSGSCFWTNGRNGIEFDDNFCARALMGLVEYTVVPNTRGIDNPFMRRNEVVGCQTAWRSFADKGNVPGAISGGLAWHCERGQDDGSYSQLLGRITGAQILFDPNATGRLVGISTEYAEKIDGCYIQGADIGIRALTAKHGSFARRIWDNTIRSSRKGSVGIRLVREWHYVNTEFAIDLARNVADCESGYSLWFYDIWGDREQIRDVLRRSHVPGVIYLRAHNGDANNNARLLFREQLTNWNPDASWQHPEGLRFSGAWNFEPGRSPRRLSREVRAHDTRRSR